MRTGNAVLIGFFVWLSIYLPRSMYTMTQSYPITDIYGIHADNWMLIGFLLPLCAAIISAVCGKEKNKVRFNRHPGKKPAVIIEKEEDIKEPATIDFEPIETKPEPVETIEKKPIEIDPVKLGTQNTKTVYNTKDVENKVDKLTSKKEIEIEE